MASAKLFDTKGTKVVMTGRNTLSSIKKVRIIANKPAVDNTSDINDFIGRECDVIEEIIVDPTTMEKEVVVLLYDVELTLYPREYEVVEEKEVK